MSEYKSQVHFTRTKFFFLVSKKRDIAGTVQLFFSELEIQPFLEFSIRFRRYNLYSSELARFE